MTERREPSHIPGHDPQDSALFALDVLVEAAGADCDARPGASLCTFNTPLWSSAAVEAKTPHGEPMRPVAPGSRSTPLLAAVGALALSVGVLGYAAAATPRTIVVEAPARPAPTMTEMTAAPRGTASDPAPEEEPRLDPDAGSTHTPEPVITVEPAPKAGPDAATPRKRKSSPPHRKPAPTPTAPEPKVDPVDTMTTADPFAGVGADCILDPSQCGSSPIGSATEPRTRPDGRATSPIVPPTRDKLSATDIRTAMAPVKVSAKTCAVHGAESGEKVGVRLSIEGATGHVTRARPQAPHADDALGRCVADALDDARFPTFAKPSMGLVYRVTM